MKKKKETAHYYATDRVELKKLIPENVKYILDVGCGTGITWKDDDRFTVTGIEIIPDVAKIAKNNIENIIIGNVEDIYLKENYFDCIVFGDILEHLYDPWFVLKQYKKYLKENGYILASIPNIQYYKIVRKLIFKGEWEYKDYGILDIDHIRFFTYKSVVDLFSSANINIIKINKKFRGSKRYRYINRLFFNIFDNFLTAQFIILGKK